MRIGKFYICFFMKQRRSIGGLKFLNQTMALLLLLLIPGLTFLQVFAYKYQRYLLKSQLEKEWVSEMGETLFLPLTDEYASIQSGDEIELGDKKYDIITVELLQNGYRVMAFEDDLEKVLESQMKEVPASGTSKGHEKSTGVWFSKVKWDIPSSTETLFALTSIDLDALGFVVSIIPDICLDVDSPPPRLLS